MSHFPKISIVTPCYNSASFIEQTILSVLSQDYPNLEYIIVDGGSTDGTTDIIRKYESRIFSWTSEPDQGMYDAIQKGFAISSGEIMGWINSDDFLHPRSLFVLAEIFSKFKNCNWIQGLNCTADENGSIVIVREPRFVSKYPYLNYEFLSSDRKSLVPYGTLQQESTFWRRCLWEKSGGAVDTSLKLAGDFELWMRFFRHDRLFIVKTLIGAIRRHEAQASSIFCEVYVEETINVVELERSLLSKRERRKLALASLLGRIPSLMRVRRIRKFWESNCNAPVISLD